MGPELFGLFSPQCPVEPSFKVWAETRFHEIADAIGNSNVRDVDVLVPGHGDLPRNFGGTDGCVQSLFKLACSRMQISASTVEFSIVDEEMLLDLSDKSATGLYFPPESGHERPHIMIASSLIADPERLLAVISHELAHEVLRLRLPHIYDDPDMEECTDMVPTMFGFGVFLANATLRESAHSSGGWFYWSWSQSGYLNAESHGYLLALFAWVREERSPAWAAHLRLDARDTLKSALKFLRKTNDCLIDQDFRFRSVRNFDGDELSERLADSSLTWQMQSLVELESRPTEATTLQSEICSLLRSESRDIAVQAIHTLKVCISWHPETLHELLILRSHNTPSVRRELVAALRPNSPDDDLIVTMLARLLSDPDLQIALAAAGMLSTFESIPDSVQADTIELLDLALSARADCRKVFALLKVINRDFASLLRESFGDDRERMVDLELQLREFHTHPEGDPDGSKPSQLPIEQFPGFWSKSSWDDNRWPI